MTKSTNILLGAVLLACGTGCSSVRGSLSLSREYAADRNYYLAFKVLEDIRDPDRPDPEVEKAYWDMRLEYLIDRASHAIFADREEDAIAYLNQAQALAPDNEIVPKLIDKAHRKLAARAVEHGDQALAKGDLETAESEYNQALRRVAGCAGALEGIAKVRETFDKRRDKAQEHFLAALRLYPELRWMQINWHTETSHDSNPNRADVLDLQKQARRRLAEKALQRGRDAEKGGRYGAALVEYRTAKEQEGANADVDAHIASMEREVKAEALAEEAFAKLVSEEFTTARAKLDEALKLTTMQQTTISAMLHEARRREGLKNYQLAKDLELEGKKSEALKAFQELVAAWPDGLADEKVRVDNLQHDIGNATKEWDAAEAAEQQGDVKAALQHYRNVRDYYPNWKDLKARIDRLNGQIQQ